MFGHAFFGKSYFGPAYWGPAVAGAPAAPVEEQARVKRPGPFPGAYQPKRYYLPPGWREKKDPPPLTVVRKIYIAARRDIPKMAQEDLLPAVYRKRGTNTTRLTPSGNVKFDDLRRDAAALQRIVSVLDYYHRKIDEEAEAARLKKRKQNEEAIALILISIAKGEFVEEEAKVRARLEKAMKTKR